MDQKQNEQIPANDPLFTPQAKFYDSPYNKNVNIQSPFNNNNQNPLLMTPIESSFKQSNNNQTPFKNGNIMNPSSAFKSPNIRNLFNNSESKTCEKILFQNDNKEIGDFRNCKRSSFYPDNKIFGEKNLGHLPMQQPMCAPFPLFGNASSMHQNKYYPHPFGPMVQREDESEDEQNNNSSPYKHPHYNPLMNYYQGYYPPPGMYPSFNQYPTAEFQKQLFQQQVSQNNISDIFQNPKQQSQMLQNGFIKQQKQKKLKNKQNQALSNNQNQVVEQQIENLKSDVANDTNSEQNTNTNNNNNVNQQYQMQNQKPPSKEQTQGKKTKTCNCKKTKCLKLYCDCFAGGELCGPECNCYDCCNTNSHSQVRHDAMTTILEKYPDAFSGKIQKQGKKQQHKKGCNCRKSGCQKKYCECYSAGIECSEYCKCGDQCKNMDIKDLEKRKQKEIEDNMIGLEKQSESQQYSSQQQISQQATNLNQKRQSEFQQIESAILNDMQEFPENDTLLKTPLTNKKQFIQSEAFNSADKNQGQNSPLVQKNLNGQFQSTIKKPSFIKPEKTNNNIETPKPSDIQQHYNALLQQQKAKQSSENDNNNISNNNNNNSENGGLLHQQKVKLISKDSGILQSAVSTNNNSCSQEDQPKQYEHKKQNLIIVQQQQQQQQK